MIDPTAFYPRHRTNGPFRRVTRAQPCPVCGKGDWCREFADGAVECMRVESDQPTRNDGWMHWPNGNDRRPDWRDRVFRAVPPAPRIDRDLRGRANARLAQLCPLAPHHRDQLHGRGLDDDAIARHGFGSLPRSRAHIARQLVAEFGESLFGQLPGLFLAREGNVTAPYPQLAGSPGLLVPYRNAAGQITAFQVRPDAPRADGGKYAWLSSNPEIQDSQTGRQRYPGGCGSGSPLHVVRPLEDASPGDVVVTEGSLKATIAADYLNATVIAAAGVSGFGEIVPLLRSLNATRAVIAFDADAATNPNVMQARDRLAIQLMGAGFVVDLARWDMAHKGIDDAAIAGAALTITPYPLPRRSGQLERIEAERMPSQRPRPVYTLATARAARERKYRALLTNPRPGVTVDDSATGSGKTGTLIRLLVELNGAMSWPHSPTKKGSRPVRIAYLARTLEQVRAFVAETGGLALEQHGRSADQDDPWACFRPGLVDALGKSRGLPMLDACLDCKSEHEAAIGHGWLCGFLEMKKLAEHRKLIAAPYESVLNGSEELDKFDIVAIDEDVVSVLVEAQTVTAAHVADWTTGQNDRLADQIALGIDPADAVYNDQDPLRRFVNLLGQLVAIRPEHGNEPALPRLRELCPDLPELIATLMARTPGSRSKRYAFEAPKAEGYDGAGLFPLRLARDLIESIDRELNRPDGSDTRIWLTPPSRSGNEEIAGGLKLFLIRTHLLDILKKKTVLLLDATPSPLLRWLFPDAETVTFDPPAALHVTQAVDLLGTRRQLANPRTLARVQTAAEMATGEASAPVVFTFKSLNPTIEGEGPRLRLSHQNAEYGHFGRDDRALNKFSDTDFLVVAGHYSAPLDELGAQLQAVRFSEDVALSGETLRLLPYEHRKPDGSGIGRWTRAAADPDLDDLIRHSERSTIVQTIGRGRAVLRDDRAPLTVLLLTATPVAGLPVDRLATLAELGAPPPEPGEAFREAHDRTAERNREQRADNVGRVAQAITDLQNAGETVTAAKVAERSGISRKTLYESPVLRAMLDAARPQNRVVGTVTPGTHNDIYVPDPGVTLATTPLGLTPDPARTGPIVPDSPPDLAPVRPALARADHAETRAERHASRDELAARLADLARRRGREPVPREGRHIPPAEPEQEVAS